MNNIRTCILSRTKKDKSQLLKITKLKNGNILIDKDQELQGRSCYIDKPNFNKQKLIKGNFLLRHLKVNQINEEVYEELEKICRLKI